jgi:preflagellin peptidase FlaK
VPDFATVPDILRLVVLPFFGYLAWRDIKTRRVPHRTWYPLVVLAVVLLVRETYVTLTGDVTDLEQRLFAIQVGISILFVIPLSYGFWLLGGFGAADAKAFMVIALLLPTYPEYNLTAFGAEGTLATLPVVETQVGVFSLTVLANTVLVGALYPVVLAARNGLSGYVSPGMFVATPIRSTDAPNKYGTMLEFSEHRLRDVRSLSDLGEQFSWRSLDLDALRMYLQWRGLTLDELRADPDRYRDPASLPEEPNPPGDGSIPDSEHTSPAPDGGGSLDADSTETTSPTGDDTDDTTGDGTTEDEQNRSDTTDDPWGATAFLDDIDHSAYGTTPEVLREGLDRVAEDEEVWISPGIPFIVPMFVGLLVAFTYGDVLFQVLELVGVA